ncbi:response regulator [Candidatus Bipolaricaulota bacterium]|nr:response regulator [Candidatus Bipolaricaulota bacterium]
MKRHILFVDDESNVLDGLRRILRTERGRWDMSFVDGADAALNEMLAGDFDVVVSDVNMPGKDGFALLAEMRKNERTRDVPVIILTGRKDSDIKRRALNMGATDLLSKPVDPQDLISRLRSVIRLKAYQDEIKRQNTILEHEVEERTAELSDSHLDLIWRLGKAAEYRDEETGNHVVRVGCCCRIIAEALRADDEFVELLFLTGPLHDIGKIGIPDAILMKRGPLNEDEWDVMKRHCVIGAEILREDSKLRNVFLAWPGARKRSNDPRAQNPVLKMASSIAKTHHEWWDGTGYPSRLAGEEIPLESRIVALADTYDALRSERPYKPALSEDEALTVIHEEAGRHFDPAVYAAFRESGDELRSIQTQLRDVVFCPGGVGCAT